MPVYFLEGIGQSVVKIGWAKKDAKARCSDIQRMSPVPLRILFIQHSPGTMNAEKDLHDRFAKQRLWGEWFRLDSEIKEYIESHSSDGRRDGEDMTCLYEETTYFDKTALPSLLSSLRKNDTNFIMKETEKVCKQIHNLRSLHTGMMSLGRNIGRMLDSEELVLNTMEDREYREEKVMSDAVACMKIATDAMRAVGESYIYQHQRDQDNLDRCKYEYVKNSPRRRRRPIRRSYEQTYV